MSRRRELEKISKLLYETTIYEKRSRLLSQPFDVETRPGSEVGESSLELGHTAEPVWAIGERAVLLNGRITGGAARRHPEGRGALPPILRYTFHDLWDHVAGTLDPDEVPLADVLPSDLFPIVQRGTRDGDAPDLDRPQQRHGRKLPSTTHGDRDLLDACDLFARLEFVCESPTRVV